MKKLKKGKSQKLWDEAKKIIPGGTQLLSKRPERFLPGYWPAYFKKAKGIEVTDLDGNTYYDMSLMAVGACVLGYADPDVNRAVKKVVDEGSMCTLNSPEEVELAKVLLRLNPWAGMVRYARTGGESMAIAVRIGRAYSGKDKVAFCGYHGWSDWYLASNLASDKNLDGHLLPGLAPRGVPRGLRGSAIPFHYNNFAELKKIAEKNKIGAIVMEPLRNQKPKDNFLQKVRGLADKIGAVLIFDEITSGFRGSVGGAYKKLGVIPDVVVFAKALGNGYPIAAVVGKKEIMDVAQSTFISSTYWTERIGPAAALAVIKKFKEKKVSEHINKIGKMIGDGWRDLAKKHGIKIHISPPWPLVHLSFEYKNEQEILTLFTQEMLKRGFLAGASVYVSFAHKEGHIRKYLKAADEVFAIIKNAIDDNSVSKKLEGKVASPGFHRLT